MKRFITCLLTLVSFVSLSACAKPIPATVTIINDESYGIVKIDGKLEVNNTITITAKPMRNDYVFDEWYEVDGESRYPYDFRNPLELKIKKPKITLATTWVPTYSAGLLFAPYPDETDPYFVLEISKYQQVEGETEITIPKIHHGRDVTRIGDEAFKNCNIKKVVLQENITSIGEDAFFDTNMESIDLPPTIESAPNAFKSWEAEQTIRVPSSCIVEEAGDYRTTWNWILKKDQSEDYYTSSDTGAAHIFAK